MKKYLIITLALLFFTLASADAQKEKPNKASKEKIEALKKAFITDKLHFTDSEAKVFWPVYEQHEQKIKALKTGFKKKFPRKKGTEYTDPQLEQLIFAKLEMEQEELDLRKDFIRSLKGKIPMRKIARVDKAQNAFKREMLRKMRKHRRGKHHKNKRKEKISN